MNKFLFKIKLHWFTKWIKCNQVSEEGKVCRKKQPDGYFWMCADCAQHFFKICDKYDVDLQFEDEK